MFPALSAGQNRQARYAQIPLNHEGMNTMSQNNPDKSQRAGGGRSAQPQNDPNQGNQQQQASPRKQGGGQQQQRNPRNDRAE